MSYVGIAYNFGNKYSSLTHLFGLFGCPQDLVQMPQQLLELVVGRRVARHLQAERVHVLEDELDLSGAAGQLHQGGVHVEPHRRRLVERLVQRPHPVAKIMPVV